MMSAPTLIKLSTVALVVTAMAACAPRPRPDGAVAENGNNGPGIGSSPSGNVTGGSLGGAAVPGSEQDFVVNVGDRVYFDLNSYQINAAAYPRLDAQAQWLARYPAINIRIEGNADERGTREYNLALGARRAESVRNYLVDRGVPAGRIDTISFGKERPVAAGSSEDAWARNRNAHTAIASGGSQ